MAITKEDVIDLVNERLSQTRGPGVQISKVEHHAPVYHALIASIVDAVNAEIAAVRKLIATEVLK